MPTSPLSLCLEPDCDRLVPFGKCEEHTTDDKRTADRRRPNGYQRGYTSAWAAFSKRYLDNHPLCVGVDCMALPEWNRTPATDVDHMHGHSRTCSHRYNEGHLQALCHPCHAKKTSTHDGGYGRDANTIKCST